MKKYSSFINELISNKKLVESEINNMLKKIKNFDEENFKIRKDEENEKILKIEIDSLEMYKSKIENLLNKLKTSLMKSGTFISWSYTLTPEMNLKDGDSFNFDIVKNGKIYITYHLYVKDVYLKRTKPPQYLYHVTDIKNRKSIEKNGLIIKDNINFKGSTDLDRPKAIFASDIKQLWKNLFKNPDIWEIDTTKINNKWWIDFNFVTISINSSFITYENIPKEALKLL